MRKALAVGRKEFRQIVRDRRTLMILLFIPVFFLLLFGYALTFDIKHVALAVQDRDDSVESRALVSAFLTSGYFDYAGAMHAPADLERMMDTNRARAALVIPERTGSAAAEKDEQQFARCCRRDSYARLGATAAQPSNAACLGATASGLTPQAYPWVPLLACPAVPSSARRCMT